MGTVSLWQEYKEILKEETALAEQFFSQIEGRNYREAYNTFKQCPSTILFYYLNHGEDAVQDVFAHVREEIGFFGATRMNLTLDNLIHKREKRIKNFRRDREIANMASSKIIERRSRY